MRFTKSRWKKKGLIFKPKGNVDWSLTHAQVPFAYPINNDVVRIFYATRDINSSSSVSFIDVEANKPSNIIYKHNLPVLQKGNKGTFDDSGTMPSWFLEHEGKLYLYYTAWNKSVEASYRLSIGLAVSEDQGLTFKKMFAGPILDRSIYDVKIYYPNWKDLMAIVIKK